jgi:hypothetical protein
MSMKKYCRNQGTESKSRLGSYVFVIRKSLFLYFFLVLRYDEALVVMTSAGLFDRYSLM